MSWPTATIEGVCQPTTQQDPIRSGRASFRYIDISGLDREAKVIAGTQLLASADAPSRARKVVKAWDVLVSTVRPNLNAVALVPEHLDDEIASTGFAVLRAQPRLVAPKFLYYWVQHTNFVEFLVTNATGANYPAVTDGIVKRSPLPLPPIREQQRIVELLDEADRLRQLRRQADAKVARILPVLFLHMFGDPATNPKGFRRKPLGELVRVKSGDFLPAKDMALDGSFPVYGGNGLNGRHDHYMFEEPKVVLGRVGAYCGVVHYSEPRAWITDNALYVSEKLEPLVDHYLLAALKQADLNQYAGRAGQPLISGSRIYPVEILVPPNDMQVRFAATVERLGDIDRVKSSASESLDRLWGVLMDRAFSGQLTAKWREPRMKELLAEMEQQARLLDLPAPTLAHA